MTRKDATIGTRVPDAHAEAGGASRRRAEIVAGVVLAMLSLTVALGWCLAPGESGNAVGPLVPNPVPPPGDGTLTYTAVTAPGVGPGVVTATILGSMVYGAALIGLFFYSPKPVAIRLRPRRSGAEVFDLYEPRTHSSSAPGAVLETVIRNSTLLLVFLSRSTSRSIA
ncbi:hypothetical protein Ntsu_13540 [Nocardia sp. IFM 10818]